MLYRCLIAARSSNLGVAWPRWILKEESSYSVEVSIVHQSTVIKMNIYGCIASTQSNPGILHRPPPFLWLILQHTPLRLPLRPNALLQIVKLLIELPQY